MMRYFSKSWQLIWSSNTLRAWLSSNMKWKEINEMTRDDCFVIANSQFYSCGWKSYFESHLFFMKSHFTESKQQSYRSQTLLKFNIFIFNVYNYSMSSSSFYASSRRVVLDLILIKNTIQLQFLMISIRVIDDIITDRNTNMSKSSIVDNFVVFFVFSDFMINYSEFTVFTCVIYTRYFWYNR